jgi:lipid II:glycine glycyltransferase (peptidoglycan interpeptide bridge formation enzyme)
MAEARVVSCFVRMHPLLTLDRLTLGQVGAVVQHGCTVSIDLTLSDEENWAQLRANHKRQIVRARRRGISVTIDDWDRIDEFLEMYYQTMRRVNASQYYFFPESYFTSLREAIGEGVHLVLVDSTGEDRAIGGGIFLEECRIVQYHLGATRTEFLQHQPTKLMFDELRTWAKRRGNLALHLGGGIQGEDGSNPLLHFKRGFSQDLRPFYTWRVVVDPSNYAQMTRDRVPDADPIDLRGFFPAYRREGGDP